MTSVNAPAWLIERPIAHRGLHDDARGVIENTLRAAEAAIDGGFAIECDIQLSADGEAIVFHDETLDRLTDASGPLSSLSAAEIARVRIMGSGEPPPAFAAFLDALEVQGLSEARETLSRMAMMALVAPAEYGDLKVLAQAKGMESSVALRGFAARTT